MDVHAGSQPGQMGLLDQFLGLICTGCCGLSKVRSVLSLAFWSQPCESLLTTSGLSIRIVEDGAPKSCPTFDDSMARTLFRKDNLVKSNGQNEVNEWDKINVIWAK